MSKKRGRGNGSGRGGGRRPAGDGGRHRHRTPPGGRTRRGGAGEAPGGGDRVRYEAEVLPGLVPFARAELVALPGVAVGSPAADEASADAVSFVGPAERLALDRLRTVTAVNRVVRFDVPRPKALLGDRHLRRATSELRAVLEAWPEPMHGLRIEAAGADSPVMRRLRDALSRATGLEDDPDGGELRVRLRPAPGGARDGGWEALVRLTPRPLSARAWRVCNRAGGLNAAVAAAAWQLAGARPGDRVLNAMCGSGTLLIERVAAAPADALVGIDSDPEAVACARENVRAAGVRAELAVADATRTGFADGAFDVVAADPPWGDAVGDRASVAALLPPFLDESARLLPPDGRLLVITHALRAFDAALRDRAGAWEPLRAVRVFHGGHRPAIRLLRRRGG